MGVTGARSQTSSAAPALVDRIRRADPSALVGVGLGVSNGAQAREVTGYADAVIVGSALVATLLGRRGRRAARRPERVADGGRRPRVRGP